VVSRKVEGRTFTLILNAERRAPTDYTRTLPPAPKRPNPRELFAD
jgi:hypothetical protein